jgi:hypothetical protein
MGLEGTKLGLRSTKSTNIGPADAMKIQFDQVHQNGTRGTKMGSILTKSTKMGPGKTKLVSSLIKSTKMRKQNWNPAWQSPPKWSLGNRTVGLYRHVPLKLWTVHISDTTIIFESKVSAQNVFPDLKALLCQDHMQNFRSIAHSSKKIETPKVDFIYWSKLAIPGTPIVHPRFLNPESSVYFAYFSHGWIALSYLGRSDQLLLYSDMFKCLNFDT